jgi:parallel beta-helix repeat protein
MFNRRRSIGCLFVATLILAATGCGSAGQEPDAARTLEVPEQYPTIQSAVDEAKPGDLVLVGPGTYREAVEVTVDDVAIRGRDRTTVVLDGEHSLVNGFTVAADGVAIENLTIHSYRQNGVVFSSVFAPGGDNSLGYDDAAAPLDGYRVAYVTTYNNGLYGVYAFGSRNGTIEHTYASGHPSSGFYVGQCKPCDVVLNEVVAERNSIGYYGTNASGGVVIMNSTFRANRLGIAPNSQRSERLAPQADTIIIGNLIEDNDDPTAPVVPDGLFGVGIAIGGGNSNTVERNLVRGHDGVGVLIVDLDGFVPQNNTVRDNEVVGNAIDLAFDTSDGVQRGNCFADNVYSASLPPDIERQVTCGSSANLGPVRVPTPASPTAPDYRTLPAPPAQPAMPNPGGPRVPAGQPVLPDLATITRPR